MTPRRPERSRKSSGEKGARSGTTVDTSSIVVNEWTLLFHAHLLDQLDRLTAATTRDERRRAEDAENRRGTPATANLKVLAALHQLMFEEIPQDPKRADYRQGATLGSGRAHWFRAKFGAGRFRLFFRFRSDVKIIVYVWVNDEETLRTYGSSTDAYYVFAGMLEKGNPPDNWDTLVAACRKKAVQDRTAALVAKRRTK